MKENSNVGEKKGNVPVKKKNKNAPREMSSKVKIPKIVDVTKHLQKKKQIARDPRFDNLSGADLSNESVKRSLSKSYAFVKEMRKEEIEEYKTMLKDPSLNEEERRNIQRQLTRLITKVKKDEHDELVKQVRDEFYKNEKRLVEEKGKKPYFLKDSELKKLVAKRKRETLSGSKLDKYMKRKSKKQKSKQHGMMPIYSGNRESSSSEAFES
jgi:ribosomal RNA-processing protein 36